MKFGESEAPLFFSKTPVSPFKSMQLGEFHALFYPTFVRRTGLTHTGIVADIVFSAFGEIEQQD